ncbi:MAG: ATP-binding protein [Alphaproteobacteria bacterium]
MSDPVVYQGLVPVRLGATGRQAEIDVADAVFTAVDRQALAPLLRRAERQEAIRLWVPDCGDGASALALAALLQRRLGDSARHPQPRIFATEPNEAVVKAASIGVLDRRTARAFLKAGFRRCFHWTGTHWQAKAGLRGRIIFSVHDTPYDTPFTDIDFIDASRALARSPGACADCVLRRLYQALSVDGFLFTGPGRQVNDSVVALDPVDRASGLYRRRPSRTARGRQRAPHLAGGCRGAALLERVVRHFAPAALIVDASGLIHGTTGAAARLMPAPSAPYPPTLGTATLLTLRSDLIEAFLATLRQPAPEPRALERAGDGSIQVTPLRATAADEEPLWLIELHEREDDGGIAPPGAQPEAELLRRHLVTTSESLRHAMEELATRQLTLGTANDELEASIDDLEATNRRLAAMNAELIAVRQEHERQIAELNALNLDVENLFRAGDLAVVVLDEALRLRRYTPAAGRFFRIARSDIGHIFATLLPTANRTLVEALINTQRDGHSRQVPVNLPDDPTAHAGLARVHPYRDDGERIAGVIFSVTDVSELKATQHHLERQNTALKRANEDLERFAYIASHDLKSPLRSVRTMLEFLRSDLGAKLGAENAEHLDLVADRVQQMERMIQDLLTYSRVGRQGGEPERVDVGELVTAQLEMVAPPAGFTIEVDANLPTITTDPKLLEHVVRNLVGNAIKHHDRDHGRIAVRAVADAAVPTFEVVDDGPGIPKRYHERIFEIFQKAGARTDAGGSGMGLALVKKAVERNGGTLKVISRDGERGTTFRFTWPESAAQPSDQSP